MYCDKLINIVQHSDSPKYDIDYGVIQKLDKFIKEKTTLRERENINPVKFSIEMKVKQETSLMTFVLGARCKLFKIRAFINCKSCNEHMEISDINKKLECTCGKIINPSQEDRDRVFLYFKLMEKPTICSWEQNRPSFQLDFLEQGDFENENFTLADLDSITGLGANDDLISLLKVREDKLKEYLKGESGLEFT